VCVHELIGSVPAWDHLKEVLVSGIESVFGAVLTKKHIGKVVLARAEATAAEYRIAPLDASSAAVSCQKAVDNEMA
jgi:hypothetical protein